MIRTTGFKRAFLIPSNRRPRVSSFNDAQKDDNEDTEKK